MLVFDRQRGVCNAVFFFNCQFSRIFDSSAQCYNETIGIKFQENIEEPCNQNAGGLYFLHHIEPFQFSHRIFFPDKQ
jgi:hypothetical protein